MGAHNVWTGRAKEDRQDLTRSCEYEVVRSVRSTSGGSSSRSSRSSSGSSTCGSSSSSGEYPSSGSAYSESLVCPNCKVRHPVDEKGLFCTEGEQGVLETLVAMGTLGLFCGWCYLLTGFMGFLAVHSLLYKSIYTFTAVAFLACNFLWWPVDNRCFPYEAFCNSWLFAVWRRYFRWQCVVEAPLDPSKRYIFAQLPHGVMPVGQLLSCSVVRQVFPGTRHTSGVAADMVLRTPGIRLLYSWLGIRKAGRESILEMFEQNINVAVVVGGIAEMFMVSKTKEKIYLKKRKNFTKIAIEAGADIVPVYFFGNSLLHDLVGGEGDNNWLFKLSRKFKTAFIFFYGRFGTPIPRKRDLKMVTGRPISVVQSNEPSQEYVDSLHAELLRRVEKLYYDHRPEWETRTLVIS